MSLPREDLRRACGRRVAMGFEGTELTAETKELLREVAPSAVILFARNIQPPQQTAELCAELKAFMAPSRLLVCVDQEGGRVARMREPATLWPPMAQLGAIDDLALTRKVGAALGRELRAVHIDVDLAPVLDVHTRPDNPVIGDRAFSPAAEQVAKHGIAFMHGLQDAGVGACGKHFPGHGDTDVDSHLELPRISHDLKRLRAVEWLPFRHAVAAGIDAIMSAHVVVEALNPNKPATLAVETLGKLRTELGFNGVILSDDLDMKAIADHYDAETVAHDGHQAGVDIFLACRNPETILNVYRGLVVAAEQQSISHPSLRESHQRIEHWQAKHCHTALGQAALDAIGHPAHQALASEVAQRHAELG